MANKDLFENAKLVAIASKLGGESGGGGGTVIIPSITATAESLPSDSDATVTRSGTDSAPVFNFGIPKGKTPQKGVDYWTQEEQEQIVQNALEQFEGEVIEGSLKLQDDGTLIISSV